MEHRDRPGAGVPLAVVQAACSFPDPCGERVPFSLVLGLGGCLGPGESGIHRFAEIGVFLILGDNPKFSQVTRDGKACLRVRIFHGSVWQMGK